MLSGVYSGVQKRIKDIVPNPAYVYCAAHNLNLVINGAVSEVTEVKHFVKILAEIYSFLNVIFIYGIL